MLLCWRDDPDNRPQFEAIADMIRDIILPETKAQDNVLPSSVDDGYVGTNDNDSTDSDLSMRRMAFRNHSSSLSTVGHCEMSTQGKRETRSYAGERYEV